MVKIMKNIAIIGTDTGVGKTVVTAALTACLRAKGINVAVMKPVASGCFSVRDELISEDTAFLKKAAPEIDHKLITPVTLEAPLAPMVAAELANIDLDISPVFDAFKQLKKEYEAVLVEGVGGLLVPIKENYLLSDLVKDLELEVLVVARSDLGTINHTLLTLAELKRQQIPIVGIIMNRYCSRNPSLAEKTNADVIRRHTDVPIIGVLPESERNDTDDELFREVVHLFEANVDIDKLR